jgi:hypothetical protein
MNVLVLNSFPYVDLPKLYECTDSNMAPTIHSSSYEEAYAYAT